ncbi:MAG: TolC family protein [Vulcanimicrobiaceae bacterium]
MKPRIVSLLIASAATMAASMPYGAIAAQDGRAQVPAHATLPTPQPTAVFPRIPSVARGYRSPAMRPGAAEIVGVAQQPFVGLALPDAVGMALLKNPNLSIAASNTRIASYQVQAARGAFDVHFVLEPSVKHGTSAATNAFFAGGNDFQPIVQNTQTLAGGVKGQLPSGQQYSVSLSQSKINDNTFIDAFNPYYPTSLNVSLTQPLLKNAGINPAKRNLLLSVVNADVSVSQTLADASTTIADVEDAYWDLVAAWRAVAIDEQALHQAVAQQASNVRLAKAGQAAPIDAVESSTQVSTYQDRVFEDLQQVSVVQNTLKALLLDDPSSPLWRANLVPTSPVLQTPQIPSFDTLLAAALKHRPEVRQIADVQRQADINLRYAKNQALPQADLQMNYQSNGFAGNALPPLGGVFGNATPPPYMVGSASQSYNNLWSGKFPTYSVGVVVDLPIGNTTARADLAAAREQELQAQLQGRDIRQRVVFEVRNAYQAYQTAVASLSAASAARSTASQVYASEERKFRNGASTTFLVLQRQVELVQAEGRELAAQTALNKAIVELQRVDGSILNANDVQLAKLGGGAP